MRLTLALALLTAATIAPPCLAQPVQANACSAPMAEMTAPDGTRFVRTRAACFKGLPDWPFEEKSVEIDGLRQGYVDEGPRDGQVILMLHGQPSWSYLYRYMIRDLAAKGYRAIAMDHLGFGNSDKPTDLKRYSFKDHAHRLVAFMDALKLQKVTLFAQDWGSIIGLYVAGGDLNRFDRMIIGNGGLPVVKEPAAFPADIAASNAAFRQVITLVPPVQPPFFDAEGKSLLPAPPGGKPDDLFGQWMSYAMFDESFKPSVMLEALTYKALTPEQRAAYDAPYPSRIAAGGYRTFPSLRNQLVGITEARLEALKSYKRPFLLIFGANDPGLAGEGDARAWMKDNIPGAKGQPHYTFPDASHFLQDDKGPEIAVRVDAFIKANP